MAEYIVNTGDGANVASVEYDITIEPVMRINLVTATFNKDRATEIVRCRDCKKWKTGWSESTRSMKCFHDGPDGFCAWGEPRREE